MAQFIALDPSVMVNGQTVLSVIDGMGKFQELALEILEENNISDIEPDKWYRQQDWLNAFKDIAAEVGENTLFNIGKSIPKNAKFPPEIDSIEKGLAAIDVAYHMNHSIKGKPMFNPEDGRMLDGIGSYRLESVKGRTAKMICKNPYPCDFDRGIIASMAQKFEATAEVSIDTSNDQRKKGGDSTTYNISW